MFGFVRVFAWVSGSLTFAACGGTPQERAVDEVKAYVEVELETLRTAAEALQAAAPSPDVDGWNTRSDADAVDAMKVHWREARVAYERIEGAIAVLFPDLDAATDERYDGFLAEGADTNLFDGEGVIGVHAIERIVWADVHPQAVVDFESSLPGYTPAAFPADSAQASAFKDGLCQRLIDDVGAMQEGFGPLALDPTAAYEGVVGSMAEQVEKVVLGATGESESRYADHTLADMGANLEGGHTLFAAFGPWLEDVGADGEKERVDQGFDRVTDLYAGYSGNGLPAVPATWDPVDPSPADLNTPYGLLWTSLSAEADPNREGSLVGDMIGAASALGLEINP
jgi:iron uptake system component EfeO